jgi:glucokinase
MQFSYPIMLCDIGGTNVRVACQQQPGAPLTIVARLQTKDFEGLEHALLPLCSEIKPKSLLTCGAGIIDGMCLKLTNAPWHMDGRALTRHLGVRHGLLLNDFEAQALSLPVIHPAWTINIGSKIKADPKGVQVILGPGTGLGIGALVLADGRYLALASEACHIGFAPLGAQEEALWPYLERVEGRVTAESVMSGPGLVRVHRANLAMLGLPDEQSSPSELVTVAEHNPQGPAAESVQIFWRMIARFAGDMAITYMATGGVTLSGGILPRLIDFLDPQDFRRHFEDKAPVESLAKRIPTRLLTAPDSVLYGMSAIASHPHHYAIDYTARSWT